MPRRSSRADLVEPLGDLLPLAGVDGGQHGRQRPGLRAGGLRQQEDAVGVVDEAAEAHHVPAAGQRRHRESVRYALAERAQVRLDVVDELGTALMPAEPGDHLVQDEQRAVLVAQAAQAVEVARGGRLDRLGLQDHRGDLARMGVEQAGQVRQVVVGELDGELPGCLPGCPADIGVVTMNQSSVEKNGWSRQTATMSRPV